jgi:hypothetical protein
VVFGCVVAEKSSGWVIPDVRKDLNVFIFTVKELNRYCRGSV